MATVLPLTIYSDSIDELHEGDSIVVTGLTANSIILSSNPPETSTSDGVVGTITWDTSYLYVCVATNTWKRVLLSTWS